MSTEPALTSAMEDRPCAGGDAPTADAVARPTAPPIWPVPAAFFVVFGALALIRHHALGSWTFDLGIKAQLLLNAWEGRWFESSLEVNHYLGDHVNPTFYLLTPVFGLTRSPAALIVLQCACVALGGWIVGLLARRWLPERPALAPLAAAVYLFQCSAGNIALYDVHEMAFGGMLALLAVYAFDRKWWVLAFVATLLAVGCKETGGLVAAAIGTWLLLFQRRWVVGAVMIALGVAYTYFAATVIMPHFRGEMPDTFEHYARLGGTPSGMLQHALHDPLAFVGTVLNWKRIGYLAILLLPTLFVPLRYPITLLPVVWVVLPNLLSDRSNQFTCRWQYDAAVIPFVAIAMLESWRRLVASGGVRWWQKHARRLTIAALLLSTANSTVFGWGLYLYHTAGRRAAFDKLAAQIPPDAPLSASINLGPHLVRRQLLEFDPDLPEQGWPAARFPSLPHRTAEYVLLDYPFERFHFGWGPKFRGREGLRAYLAERGYISVGEIGGFELFRLRTGQAAPDID